MARYALIDGSGAVVNICEWDASVPFDPSPLQMRLAMPEDVAAFEGASDAVAIPARSDVPVDNYGLAPLRDRKD